MNEETPWIWNKGIAALCDHRMPDDFPQGKYRSHKPSPNRSQQGYYSTLADKVLSGDLIWVKVSWLPYFVNHVLGKIKNDFVLVTCDSDLSIPSSMQSESRQIVESPKVIHWYTQNFDGTDMSKISPLPIGIDFHSIQQQDFFGITQTPISKQSEVLEFIRQRLPPTNARKQKLYVDSEFAHRIDSLCHGAANELSRSAIHRILSSDPAVHCQPDFLPQFKMWAQRGQFAYVLSHHGNGLDCHRTWEALALGHVLVVQKSSLDSLYEGLPVIIIDDWRAIKTSKVSEHLCLDSKLNWSLEKLTNRYWVNLMRSHSKQ